MVQIYLEITIQLLAKDPANHMNIKQLLDSCEHCITETGSIKYLKLKS